jgi:DnaK suppressor protein
MPKSSKTAIVRKNKSAAARAKPASRPSAARSAPAGRVKAAAKSSASKPRSQATPARVKKGASATKVASRPKAGRAASTASRPRAAERPKAAAGKRTSKKVVDRFVDDQRAALLEERRSLEQQAESFRAEAEQLAEEMEPGDTQFDEESGEGGTLNIERERDLALSAQARDAIEEIDRALERIDSGTYGVCEQCGQPIPKARLKAIPSATLCVACKSGGLSRR